MPWALNTLGNLDGLNMTTPVSPPPTDRPTIFILCLDKEQMYEGMFDSMYSALIDSLLSIARLQRARTLDAARRYLSNPENRPTAILIPDPSLTIPENMPVLDQV